MASVGLMVGPACWGIITSRPCTCPQQHVALWTPAHCQKAAILPLSRWLPRLACIAGQINEADWAHGYIRQQSHLAMMNSSRTMRDPSPMYFCTSSDPDTRMKVQSVWWATARASRVFPVPGGPYSRTPCGRDGRVDQCHGQGDNVSKTMQPPC